MSQEFSRMPSDFTVDSKGSVKLGSLYINNLYPVLHKSMYGVVEEVITAFVPTLERVLGDSNRENDPIDRIKSQAAMRTKRNSTRNSGGRSKRLFLRWVGVAFDEACKEPSSKLGVLPQELRDLVKDNFPTTVMTLKEAEAYRLKLMKELMALVVEHASIRFDSVHGILVISLFQALSKFPTTMSRSARWRAQTLEDAPTWVLPNPFEPYAVGQYDGDEWGPRPFTTFERTMCELSWALRSKPDWQRKAADPEIRSKWRQEALEHQAAVAAAAQDPSTAVCLTEKMIDYVLAELDGYAEIADNERGIERACFDAIWYSDRLISNEVLERLKSAVKTLEDIPEEKKDWHPGTNKQVLDLVHPSLYCVVYDRTHAYLPRQTSDRVEFPSSASSEALVRIYVPGVLLDALRLYVLHQSMYPVIEEVLTAFVALFERVLGDSNRENDRVPFPDDQRLEGIECIWGPSGQPYPEDGSNEDEFFTKIAKVVPEAKDYTGQLQDRFSPVSLRGRTIQCIIKLANIHLTPEQSEYTGGSWHVEGMENERIVASGVYYYDEENITESRLSFRVAVGEPEYHNQDDSACMRMLYDMDGASDLVQDLGSVVTKAGRALSWPNLFQHCVSPFKLADPSKPGHRKILAIFLVDPTQDRIVSATDVPPQQADWAAMAFEEACKEPSSVVGSLPQELRDLVKDYFPETVMTLKEAEAYRLELMKERTVYVAEHAEEYIQTFNMCEH
ncbi:hypothetical protein MSAN_01173600 [Mycena sanguinolenta]|uniref:Uncharacterized protein n=1 Tax=Mycena sanguinolenta TaxID=230812 RepID=A0A8H7D4R1_9AGAR|nr:hypothetical protein MSAN_01173600 [Mycena sanguinolenta]